MPARVLEPELDVRRRVEDVALDDERVAVVGQPAGETLVPRDVPVDRPVGHQVAPAPLGEAGRCAAHHGLDDLVAGEPGVAVGQRRVGRRRDHERRVGGDHVERLVGDRVPQRSVAQVDLDPVEGGVEGGDGQGPGVHVGGDDVVGVGGQVERLHAAAGAEVERAGHRVPRGEQGEGGRRGRDSQDVVGVDPDRLPVEAWREVADDPPGVLVIGVGAAVEDGAHLSSGGDEHAGVRQRVDQRRERGLGFRARDAGLEEEQPDQRRERRPVRRTPQRGGGLMAVEGGARGLAEQVADGVDAVAGRSERVAQGKRERGVGDAAHPRGGRQQVSGPA